MSRPRIDITPGDVTVREVNERLAFMLHPGRILIMETAARHYRLIWKTDKHEKTIFTGDAVAIGEALDLILWALKIPRHV